MASSGNAAHKIANADHILLMLDYDGTLTPIVRRPEEAVIPQDTREILLRLTDHPRLHICIISGRSLNDLMERVHIPGIIYAGNHGLEANGIQYEIPGYDPGKVKETMRELSRWASRELKEIGGVIIDSKGLTVSIHYRLTAEKDMPRVRQVVEHLVKDFPGVKLTLGKKVFEIRPKVAWDKGAMAMTLLELMRKSFPGARVLPIYIGDDTTDEDAFRSLSGAGITILVSDGKMGSKARYRVDGTEKVVSLLEELDQFLRIGPSSETDPSEEMRGWANLRENP